MSFLKETPSITYSLENEQIVDITFVVLGELYLGAYRSSDPEKHLKQVRDFLTQCRVLAADEETANFYALIKAALLNKGKPIPENDVWIDAIARQYGKTLITEITLCRN